MTPARTAGTRAWRSRRRPPTHVYALVLLLVAFALMLTTDALVRSSDDAPEPLGPSSVASGGAGGLLDVGDTRLRTARGDGSTTGLIVFGLPSSAELRRLLRSLAGHDVRGTWFLAGEDIRTRGDDVRQIREAGFELGVTGFSGADLRGLRAWRVRLELSLAQAALAAREGIVAPLLFLPATPTESSLDRRSLRAGRTAAESGYLLAAAGEGDGDSVIQLLDARLGVVDLPVAASRLNPVSTAVGLRAADVNQPASTLTRANGQVVMATIRTAEVVVGALRWSFLPITLAILARAVLALVFASLHALRRRGRPTSDAWTGPVTIVVPAYNEMAGIVSAVRSFLTTEWAGGVEVVVVDDGSTDGTADVIEALGMTNVRVIRQENGGKPAAMNTGIASTVTEVIVFVDGDTLFQSDTIGRLVTPLADPRVGAVSGNAKVLNRRSLLGRWQHIEYVIGFNLDRRLLDTFGAIPTVPGAIGAFRREALVEVGGVSEDTLAEDTDLTIGLSRLGWRVVYEPRAIAWTEAPSSVGDLWRQRYRWSYGTMQAAWKHRRAFVEPRTIGPVGLSYALVFQVLLALLGPVLDITALHALFIGDGEVLTTWVVFAAAQLGLAVFAFALDRESLRPLWAVPLQQIVYRQLMYLVVIQSVIAAFTGTRLRWHKLHRIGLEGHGVAVGSSRSRITPQPEQR